MKKITIQPYFGFVKRSTVYRMPEHWYEIPQDAFIRDSQLYNLLYFSVAGNAKAEKEMTLAVRTTLLPGLLQMTIRKFKRLSKDMVLQSLIPTTEFLHEKVNISTVFVKNIRLGSQQLKGPAENLSDVTFAEFVYADTFYLAYLSTRDEKYISKLVSALYRPPALEQPTAHDFKGYRQPFNEKTLPYWELRIKKCLPETVKQAIFVNYAMLRSAITPQYTSLFSAPPENSEYTTDQINPRTWVDMVNNLRPRWKANDELLNLHYADALSDIDTQIAENRRKKRK